MPMGMEMGGNSLRSPEDSGEYSGSRPSSLVESSSGEGSPAPGSGGGEDSPNRQMTQVISQVREMETKIESLAKSYPGAAPHARKAVDALRKVLQQIVATGSGPGQETPSPRMLG